MYVCTACGDLDKDMPRTGIHGSGTPGEETGEGGVGGDGRGGDKTKKNCEPRLPFATVTVFFPA